MSLAEKTILNRKDTDAFFPLEPGALRYRHYGDEIARYVEKEQLCDTPLWEQFILQFSGPTDDCNLGWRGEYWGKMMRGGCLTYRYTKSPALYKALTDSAVKMLEMQDSLGRFSTYSVEKEFNNWDIWSRKYILLGYEYYYDICKSKRLKSRIVKALCPHADYIIKFHGKGKRDIRFSNCWGGLNSCSVLEGYMRLYNITGKKRYLDFASYIISTGFCLDGNYIELASKGIPPYKYPVTKAYEMMSCFEGLLEYYRVTKNKDYLDTVIKFADSLADTDMTAIGCLGCKGEELDNAAVTQTKKADSPIMQETCVTVTWMKLCFQLLILTGEERFADRIERAALNALAGAVNDKKNITRDGVLPFDSYSPLYKNRRGTFCGGYQLLYGEGEKKFYGCCACIGSAGTALGNLFGVLKTAKGIVINLYEKGAARFVTPSGNKAQIRIISRLPEGGRVKIRLDLSEKERFSILLRIPEWSANTTVECKGVKYKPSKATYLTLENEWENGDEITLCLDVRAKITGLNGKVSVSKGGYVLASDARLGNVDTVTDFAPNKKGFVKSKAVKTEIEANHAFEISQANGESITLIDYASAGKEWNKTETATISVWLDKKR